MTELLALWVFRLKDRRADLRTTIAMTQIESLLSAAELDVLEELLDGLTNRQIGKRLKLSDKTVKNHISHILTKTGCSSRLELTVRVYKERERELKRRLRAA